MSQAAVSPRDLVLRSGTQTKKSVTPVDIKAKPDIGAGNQRLHSFYRPGLAAGTYNIDVEHCIAKHPPASGKGFLSIPSEDRLEPKKSTKSFTVVAPRYSLPAGSVNTTYPAPGHHAPHTTLAHVVLNDPQSPWERVGSNFESLAGDNREALSKTRTPWLAVLVFTQEEIMLPPDVQGVLKSLLDLPKSPKPFAPSPTFTYNVNMAKFINNVKESKDSISTPLEFLDASVDDPETTQGDIVCVKKEVLQELVRAYDDKGQPTSSQPNPDVSRYRWLAHVRRVDTAGMAQAGSTTGLLGERDSLFSVVLSHRTGPINATQPTSVIAHLVSIEGLEAMPFPFVTPYVALTSLHSWSYMSLPAGSISLHDAFKNLGNFKQPNGVDQPPLLRAPVTEKELSVLRAQGDAGTNTARRLETGYSLARYRLQTGEQTVSFYRGPLVPARVPHPLQAGWDAPSTHGTDRQIFDRQAGIMDISYSTAWQLGRTLALADRTFTVALARLRRQIQEGGVEVSKREEMENKTLFRTKPSTIQSLATSMNLLEQLPASDALLTSDVSNRWKAKTAPQVNVSFKALSDEKGETQRREKLQRQLNTAAEDISGSLQDVKIPYDEFNTPRSTDWMTVLKWLLDKMYLADIPANYLISDPSHLPLETIRFFEIDRNWTDSLIDGALSLANHLERDDDMIRRSLQHALRRYLSTPSRGLGGLLPPVPMYGFLLRSELITAFPDMVVKTEPTLPDNTHPVLIRHELLETNVMLCLFDRCPAKASFESVTLSQPPHQPCFSVAAALSNKEININLKSVYSAAIKDQPHGDGRSNALKNGQLSWERGETPTDDKPTVFTWDVNDDQSNDAALRFLNINSFATWAHKKVVAGMKDNPQGPSKYSEDLPTSSLVAYQLNDPSWQFKMQLKPGPDGVSAKNSDQTTLDISPAREMQTTHRLAAAAPSVSMRSTPLMVVAKRPTRTLKSLGKTALQRSQPLLLLDRPPHLASLPTAVITPPSEGDDTATATAMSMFTFMAFGLGSETPISQPASLPTFTLHVSPLDSEPSPSNPFSEILTPSPTPQDLIFSIVLTSSPLTLSNFFLQKITISIPFTRSQMRNNNEVLTTDYTGPGGFMATNLRFNVVCSLVREAPDAVSGASRRLLKIELLPRTHLGRVFAGGCKDLTFLLGGVVVADVFNKEGGEKLGLEVRVKWADREEVEKTIWVERARKGKAAA
ncbi:hypothetical protein QBC43DRAFT_349619 [Cladorrhinum sp. PSN259]|nr:hypothetical protein QBC43DRAFT_349619 [Cladorrhinum sp. PSN259]